MLRDLSLLIRRVGAYLIDIVLLFAILAPLAFLGERLLGIRPEGGFQIWLAAVLSFSVPVWIYFVLADASRAGRTIGKRVTRISVRPAQGSGRLGLGKALLRTALKLVPWELAHLLGFALVDLTSEAVQLTGLIAANVIALAYLGVCVRTRGRQSLHDMAVGTFVMADGP